MIIRIINCAVLLTIVVVSAIYKSENVALVSDYVINLHACTSLQLGTDHVE